MNSNHNQIVPTILAWTLNAKFNLNLFSNVGHERCGQTYRQIRLLNYAVILLNARDNLEECKDKFRQCSLIARACYTGNSFLRISLDSQCPTNVLNMKEPGP